MGAAQVFAYGQTGTGKTHTMEGDLSNDDLKGVIPRAVEAIFERLHDKKYASFSVTASYLEIYNEELTDLLVEEAPLVTPRGGFGNGSNKADASSKLQLVEEAPKKQGERGSVSVRNLSNNKVEKSEDVLSLIKRAQERRRVGETKMNKHSSRSHCVFTLTVSSTRPTSDGGSMECSGKLHLVDLAGSECSPHPHPHPHPNSNPNQASCTSSTSPAPNVPRRRAATARRRRVTRASASDATSTSRSSRLAV